MKRYNVMGWEKKEDESMIHPQRKNSVYNSFDYILILSPM